MRMTSTRSRTFLRVTAFAAAVMTALAVTTSVASANSVVGSASSGASVGRTAPPATGNVSSSAMTMQSFGTADEAENYWTTTRMARALTADSTAPTPRESLASTASAQLAVAAVRTDIPPTVGALGSKPETLRALVTRPYTNRTDRLNGKVFFSEGGLDYVCSGTVVNSTNKDMIDTAGHCVSDGAGSYVKNWIFVPGYASNPSGGQAGMYPYGIWRARKLVTTAQWHYYSNVKQDLAYGVVSRLGNRHIAAYLGGQGTYFNVTRNQIFNAFGYPQASPFNGRDQRLNTSRRNGDDLLLDGSPGPRPMRIASNLTGGASGGGWIINISATTGLGHVNGHNSYRYLVGPMANPNRLYSPYYGNEALSLYRYATAQ